MKLAVATSFAFAAGCLPNPGAVQAPECVQSSDCPAAGEVCDEGLCWGDAPPGAYAALIAPPSSNRHDLVVTELPTINVPQDGDLGDQIIAAPVQIGGRVHLGCMPNFSGCDPTAAVAATITVTRPSRIQGGPEYVDAGSSDASITSGDSFTMEVPRLGLSDSPYTVTIIPDDTMSVFPNGPTAAALAPPLTISVAATDDVTGQDLVLGQGALRTVSGRIVDATGAGVPGVKVDALGRFADGQPLARVSTVAVTDLTGYYTIEIAEAAQSTIDLVGVPADKPAMTLMLAGVVADQPQQLAPDMGIPATGKPIAVTLPIVGHSSAGVATPVAAASVDVTATLDAGHPGQTTTYEIVTSTDTLGNASLMLLPASGTMLREYHVRINPAPTSEFASVYDQVIDVSIGGGVLGEIDLPHRVAITGQLLDHQGFPAAGVTVTAQPSLSLLLSLDAATQTLLSSLQPPTATTMPDGGYSLWVDPDLAGTAAKYDLVCVPPAGSPIPRATIAAIAVDMAPATERVLPWPWLLPQGRHVRARIVDDTGAIVTGAEFRLYATMTDPALCTSSHLPAGCVPATLLSVDQSDDDGKVRLVLPDSRP